VDKKLDLNGLFSGAYQTKKVFLTGHTGFKGSWLALWLKKMGAEVVGYSLDMPSPNHFDLLDLDVTDIRDTITDIHSLKKAIQETEPDIIFHLAAQPLVITAYNNPTETYEANVMGTMNILEVARQVKSVKAICVVTTDKCYLNKETQTPYSETDSLGGKDPYSASKACAEIMTDSYRHSFLSVDNGFYVASCRGGNVIGGGDWGENRLIPDIVKAVSENKETEIRSPNAIRPWQHVLDCLSGYLTIGKALLEQDERSADAWNVGPKEMAPVTVKSVIELMQKRWPEVQVNYTGNAQVHEAGTLMLNPEKIMKKYNWKPIWNTTQSIEQTTDWYQQFYKDQTVTSEEQLNQYCAEAKQTGVAWAT